MKLFGHAHRSLDAKGRLILPPSFREPLMVDNPEAKIILTLDEGHVIGLTPAQWERIEKQIENHKNPTRGHRNRFRVLYSGYEEVTLSKQGRIQIPSDLRISGKLDQNVVVAGMGKRFEIWDKVEYEALLAMTPEDDADDFSLEF